MYLRSSSYRYPSRGFGDVSTLSAAQLANQGLTVTTNILKAIGTIGGPVGSIISSIGQLGVMLAQVFRGCGQTCVQASNIANQVEPLLLQNLQQYLASPVRTQSMQAAALNNFDTAWAALTQACGQAALQQAGVNCVTDRQQGACKWKASAGGWTKNADGTCSYANWGTAGSGSSCWNWFVGYRDPIANDPCVQPDSVLSSSSTTPATGGVSPLLIAAGLAAAAFLLGGD